MKKIIWQLVGLTFVMIISLTGAIVGTIFLLLERFSPELLGVAVISVILVIWSIKTMIVLNRKYKELLQEQIRAEGQFITEWTCDGVLWKTFIEEQWKSSLKDARITGLWAGGIMAVVLFFFAQNEMRMLYALGIGLGAGGAFFLFISTLIYWGSNVKFKKFAKSNEGLITFGKSTVQLNHLIIDWSQSRVISSLEAVSIDESFQCPVIQITIRNGSGSRSNTFVHSFPIPPGKIEEARKIVEFYKSTLS